MKHGQKTGNRISAQLSSLKSSQLTSRSPGEYPRLSRGRPGFDSPPGSECFDVEPVFRRLSLLFFSQAIPLIFIHLSD